MTLDQVMSELKKRGTAQNVKIYKRHGAGDNLFGVSFAHLGELKRKIKIDHALGVQLWETGNSDAQSLATMIIDPSQLKPAQADKWIAGISYYLLSDLLSAVIARAPFARATMDKWMQSKKEFVRACGYNILGGLLRDGVDISDADCEKYLKTIEKEIHSSPNRARHSMNGALMGIGIYRSQLTQKALAAAGRIGKVEVDHGETGCKTPDAIPYIQKALARKK
ncbi:MAG TPA: DNA alkylation repair protein [candidate division Zixibacteria bacterium]|jgi:3-methyladenine DNA glycosylase AlkD